MNPLPQDSYWPPVRGEAIGIESHYGRSMRCLAGRPLTIGSFFRDTVARFGPREALVAGALRLCYDDVHSRVENLAGHLAARGVKPRQRVLLLMGNGHEFLLVLLACVRLDAIAVPASSRMAAAEVEHVMRDCAPVAVIFESSLADRLPAHPVGDGAMIRISIGADVDGAERIEDLLLGPPSFAPQTLAQEEDTAILLYTSGTTGRPKGARLTHLGVVHSVMHFTRCMALDENDRSVVAVPVSHVTGIISLLLTTVYAGGCSVLLRDFKAAAFLALAQEEAMSYTLMVPAMYTLCLRDPALAQTNLRHWRVGGFGGTPMPAPTVVELARRLPGLVLTHVYGATETTSPTTIMPAGSGADRPESVGQVVPCGEVRVVDLEGRPVPAGTWGELWIGGPMVVPGYWNNPEADEVNFRDGMWRSGDIASIDAAGFVRIHDRMKDMINRGGHKIFSAEVERVLNAHPDVLECAVVSSPDPVLNERVKAFVVTANPMLTAVAIQAFCEGRLADYKIPEFVHLQADALPRNANGKIAKAGLRSSSAF